MRALGNIFLIAVALSAGCTAPVNPSFSVSVDDARLSLDAMREDPRPLQRPLVILAGLGDPGISSSWLAARIRGLTGDDRVLAVSFFFNQSFAGCRKEVIDAVDKAFPSDDPEWTSEVDVIGVSMGGLVGRYAADALPDDTSPGRRLRVARIFTISTPHCGANLAVLPTLNGLQIAMRAHSPFLEKLNAGPGNGYALYPYVRLGDVLVGSANAAPPGRHPWWVSNLAFEDAHAQAFCDPRIVADVARRLRGEAPFTVEPPEPLPRNDEG